MTTTKGTPADLSVTELRQDIEQHRAQLAATVDALAVKLDVKTRAKAKLSELRPVLVPAGGGAVLLLVLVMVRKRRRS
jgi:hypothetical protein